MRKLIIVIVLAAIAFWVYTMLTGNDGSSPTPQTSAPSAVTVPAPGTPGQPTPANPLVSPPQPLATPTLAEHPGNVRGRQIIYDCAKRAGWKITSFQLVSNGVARVTGNAPNDNVANQRFMEELERSGILLSCDTAAYRPFMSPDQRSMLEITFLIKWR